MANQEPFSFGNGKRAQEQVPHSGVHHDERPFEESDIPLSQARLKIPEGSRDIIPLTQLADVKQEAPTKTRESFTRRHRRGIAGLVTTAIVGVGGTFLVTHGGESTEPGAKEPGISNVDTDALRQKDRMTFEPGILEGISNDAWGSVFNQSTREDLNWLLGTIVENPTIPADRIPVDDITDTPNSEIIKKLRSIGEQIRAENPDAVDIGTFVCPTASNDTAPQDYGCSVYSTFDKNPERYPDQSYLRIEFNVQDKDGNYSEHELIEEKLDNPYHLVQQEDGTIKINEN